MNYFVWISIVHSLQVIDLDNDITKTRSNQSVGKSQIHSGTIDEKEMNTTNLAKSAKSSDTDWSQPVKSTQMNSTSGGGLDWSQPVSSNITQTADAMDWGAPVSWRRCCCQLFLTTPFGIGR